MRVLYLTPGCFDKGGISRYNRYQVSALRELCGHDAVDVYSVLGPGVDSFEAPIDTRFAAGGLRKRDKARYLFEITRRVLSARPGLVLAAHVRLSGIAHMLARSVGATSVLNVYGSEVWSGFRPDARWGLEHVDHVVADCHFTARYIEGAGHRSAMSTSVVWDCVDLTHYAPGEVDRTVLERYGIPDPSSGFNLLTLGRMSPDASHKGYDRLLEAFSRVAGELPKARLVYAGRGGLIEVLRARAAELGLAERVYFTGMIREEDMPAVYRSAHAFSLVSDRGPGRGEGIPLTPLEAAACGLPILVGNHDGSQEAIVDGRNGFVLDPFDLDAHAALIRRLVEDDAERARLSVGAAEVAREVFSYERFREEHRVLLERWRAGAAR